MKTYYVYDSATGIFTGRESLGSEIHPDDVPEGHEVIELDERLDAYSHRLDLEQSPAAVIDYQPAPPADDARRTWAWDAHVRRWAPVPTLAAKQAARWEAVKRERAQRLLSAGAAVDPPLDSDPQAVANINGVVTYLLAHPDAPGVTFTCADNERRQIARADFIAAATTVLGAMQAVYDSADALRQQIAAATTDAELAAVEWPD